MAKTPKLTSWREVLNAPFRDPATARASRPELPQTPFERRADQTTQYVRGLADAEAQEAAEKTARLKAARLAKEAAAKPAASPTPPDGRKD
jgi:hypothetical protein